MQPPFTEGLRRSYRGRGRKTKSQSLFRQVYKNLHKLTVQDNGLDRTPHGKRDVLLFNITEDDLASLLSYSTGIELGVVTINDCDNTMSSNFNSRELTPGVSTVATDLLHKYKDVIEGLGDLPGEYHIVTDDVVPPVVHPPSRVPVALYETRSKRNWMRW